jgi:hypothetical protein
MNAHAGAIEAMAAAASQGSRNIGMKKKWLFSPIRGSLRVLM